MPNDFTFTPATGLKDTNVYVDNPADPRGEIQGLLDQLKDHMNTEFKPLFASGALAKPGYIDIPIGNKVFTLQWGNGTTGGTTVASGGVYVATMPITFPKPFTTECLYTGAVNILSSITWFSCAITNLINGTLYFTCPSGAPTDAANKQVKWWAFGY